MKKVKLILIGWLIIMGLALSIFGIHLKKQAQISPEANKIIKKVGREKEFILIEKKINLLKDRISNKSTKVKREVIYISLLKILSSKQDFKFSEIKKYIKFSLKLGLSKFEIWKPIGDYYKNNGRLEKAKKCYLRAIDKFNQDKPIVYRLKANEQPVDIYNTYNFLINYEEERGNYLKAINDSTEKRSNKL